MLLAQKFYCNNSITFSESAEHLAGVVVKEEALLSVFAEVIETDKALLFLTKYCF